MGMDAQAGLPRPAADRVEDLVAGQRLPGSRDPEGRLLGPRRLWVAEIAHQRLGRRVAVDDGPAATALRGRRLDEGQPLAEVEIAQPKRGQLAAADAGVEQQRQHGQVAAGDQVGPAAGGRSSADCSSDSTGGGLSGTDGARIRSIGERSISSSSTSQR